MSTLSPDCRDNSQDTPAGPVPPGTVVWTVHTVQPDEVRPTVLICSYITAAEDYAAAHSSDEGVLAAAVTSFVLDQLGSRRAVSLWVAGERQAVPYVSNDRRIQS